MLHSLQVRDENAEYSQVYEGNERSQAMDNNPDYDYDTMNG